MEICNRGIQDAGRRWNHGHGRNYQKRVRRIQGPWGTSAFEGGGAQKSSEGQRRVRKWWYHGNHEGALTELDSYFRDRQGKHG